jgi:hypothetical protein
VFQKYHLALKTRPSGAKADIENKAVNIAVKRCATQDQEQNRVFLQPVKPAFFQALNDTAKEAAEKLLHSAKKSPQALKRKPIFNSLRHE